MAATKTTSSKKNSGSNGAGASSTSSSKSADKKLREEQKQKAAEQNKLADNAVPEQRPIAAEEIREDLEHPVRKKLRESGALQEEPMGQEAYDRANSDAQLKKAEKAEQTPSLRSGASVCITKGEYEGSYGSVQEVTYTDFQEQQKANSGDPGVARFAEVESYLVRTRGGRHALVSVKPDEVEQVTGLGLPRDGEA